MALAAAAGALSAGALAGAAPDGGSAGAAASSHDNSLLGVLRGANELTEEGRRRAGDPDGRGSASAVIDPDTDQLCFGLTVRDIGQPVAAHIHRGNRRRNGPVVLSLVQPPAGDPGASSGCVAIADDLAQALLKNPRKYYWNIHTTDFPAGAVRGQVFKRRR